MVGIGGRVGIEHLDQFNFFFFFNLIMAAPLVWDINLKNTRVLYGAFGTEQGAGRALGGTDERPK